MSQNRSNAVMASRVEAHDSLDFFPTRAWATRALCEWIKAQDPPSPMRTVWEPACGEGHMARPLAEYFGSVHSSDVYDYGFGEVRDFLWPLDKADRGFDWIVTNPPFRLGEQFARAARERAPNAALIVRTAFLESAERYELIFKNMPPTEILQFTERVPMHRGRIEAKGSTATAYCWLVWRWARMARPETHFHWLAPCRKRLERDEDYAGVVRPDPGDTLPTPLGGIGSLSDRGEA